MRALVTWLVVGAAASTLTACSGSGDDSTPPPGGGGRLPACSAVWVKGQALPKPYQGCDGGSVLAYSCHVYAYGDLWGQPGEPIKSGTAERVKAQQSC